MPPEEAVRTELVRQWLVRADEDLAACRILSGQASLVRTAVGFHAQQAVEKLLKAMLTWHQIEFPKTHDLTALLDLVASFDGDLAASLADLDELTHYAVATRYPGDYADLTPEATERALSLAERARAAVLGALPPGLGAPIPENPA
jgi:HEPN domain-containing protein